jgi:Kef-type K+ transport system membrane component KefB/Trk K+ transport system NAD-binding subunit
MLLSLNPSEDPNRFLPLLLVLALAFLVPIVLARFRRVPIVVGEILAGIVLGPTLLGWVTEGPILTFMSDIGLAFLMFLAGMEIDLASLIPSRNGKPRPSNAGLLPATLGVYLLTLVLAILGGFLMVGLGAQGDPWLLAFVFTATSLGVVLPILKERAMLDGRFGQFVLLSATLADFITVILLTVYIITFDRGFDLEILSLGLLFLAFLIFYRIGPGFVRIPAVRNFIEELSQATVQIKVRGAILILMTFVVLAEFVDAELILGAFLAGMIISLLKDPEDEGLIHKLEAFGFGFFIPVFFIMVGVGLDLGALLESPEKLLLVPEMFVIALVVKGVPVLALGRQFSLRERWAGGILLNTHLSLEVAVAVIGLRTGLLDAATSTDVILFAVVTVVTMPVIFNAILPHVSRSDRRFMLAVGVNELALKVAHELQAHGVQVCFLEEQPDLVERAKLGGYHVIEGNPGTSGLATVDFSNLEAILTLTDDDRHNAEVARTAKSLGDPHVVALVEDPAYLAELQVLGVQPFLSAMHRVTMIALMARNPDIYSLLTSTADGRDISEVSVLNPELVGRRLRDLQLPGDFLVLAIRRAGELVIPHGNSMLVFGDRLTLVGDLEEFEDVKAWLENRATYHSLRQVRDPGMH